MDNSSSNSSPLSDPPESVEDDDGRDVTASSEAPQDAAVMDGTPSPPTTTLQIQVAAPFVKLQAQAAPPQIVAQPSATSGLHLSAQASAPATAPSQTGTTVINDNMTPYHGTQEINFDVATLRDFVKSACLKTYKKTNRMDHKKVEGASRSEFDTCGRLKMNGSLLPFYYDRRILSKAEWDAMAEEFSKGEVRHSASLGTGNQNRKNPGVRFKVVGVVDPPPPGWGDYNADLVPRLFPNGRPHPTISAGAAPQPPSSRSNAPLVQSPSGTDAGPDRSPRLALDTSRQTLLAGEDRRVTNLLSEDAIADRSLEISSFGAVPALGQAESTQPPTRDRAEEGRLSSPAAPHPAPSPAVPAQQPPPAAGPRSELRRGVFPFFSPISFKPVHPDVQAAHNAREAHRIKMESRRYDPWTDKCYYADGTLAPPRGPNEDVPWRDPPRPNPDAPTWMERYDRFAGGLGCRSTLWEGDDRVLGGGAASSGDTAVQEPVGTFLAENDETEEATEEPLEDGHSDDDHAE